jgi:hypothetical protein
MQMTDTVIRTSLQNPPNTAKDATRSDIDTQLAALTAKVKTNLRRIAHLVQRGQWEKAGLVASIVATHRNRIVDLIDQRNARLAEPAKPLEPVQHRARTGTKVKVRRFKVWSDK